LIAAARPATDLKKNCWKTISQEAWRETRHAADRDSRAPQALQFRALFTLRTWKHPSRWLNLHNESKLQNIRF
jgi:hypothetical protein